MSETVLPNPDPSKVHADRHISLTHEGVHRTWFFFSYSGGLIVDGQLPALKSHFDGEELEISPPLRLAHSSFRPTPPLTFENVRRFLNVPIPTPFPLQVATFPGPNAEDGASANYWFGPSNDVPEHPKLPDDTFLVTLHGSDSANQHEKIEKFILSPLCDWLRVLTRQWWIGRTVEGASGPLHFIAPLNEAGQTIGDPCPVAMFTTAGPGMKAVTQDIWLEAARCAWAKEPPPAAQALEMDANFMLASGEFRSGVILACSAIEAARDSLLTRRGLKISDLKTSPADLLKHLSVGFKQAFGISLSEQEPELFDLLRAFWLARGEAAHGRPVQWRQAGSTGPIEEVEFGVFSDGTARILEWIAAIN